MIPAHASLPLEVIDLLLYWGLYGRSGCSSRVSGEWVWVSLGPGWDVDR